jgi:hypothetical protein
VRWWYGSDAAGLLAAAGVAGGVLFGEFAGVIWWLGDRYERFDLSRDMPQ